MIKNVIFDMGQVLIHFIPKILAEQEGVSEADMAVFLREVFQNKEWVALDRGSMEEDAAIGAICARLPERLYPAVSNIIRGWWKNPLSPVPGMGELIEELKGLGYGIYLLSNAPSNLHQYFPRIPGSAFFDGKIVSADWKLLKPEHEIYEKLSQVYSLDLSECIFVDDLPINVDAAIRTGMDGIVFHGDVRRLRRELNAAGIPVALL